MLGTVLGLRFGSYIVVVPVVGVLGTVSTRFWILVAVLSANYCWKSWLFHDVTFSPFSNLVIKELLTSVDVANY